MKKKIEYYTEYKNDVRFIECKCCGAMQQAAPSTTAIKCHLCVSEDYNKQFPLDAPKSYIPSGRPRGWVFMKEFIDRDGNVYHKGKEQPGLKGTLPSTVIKPKLHKPKLSKGQKAQLYNDTLSEIHSLKKQLSKVKFKKDKRRITSEIKKLQKTIK